MDNYNLTLGHNDDYNLSDQMVHYCGGHILQVHWTAYKAVLAFYAGSRVRKSKTSKKPEMERECLEIYYNAIEELDPEHFNKDARDFVCHSFQKKEEPMPAYSLWRYYYDSRAKIRRDLLQYYPKDLVTLKSGRGFHESCHQVYVKAYRLEMGKAKVKGGAPKYTAEEIEEMHPPHHWEYTKSPWHFGLLIKIFRRDPQLALHVASVMSDPVNAPVSRAELRRQKQVMAQQKQKGTSNKENRGPPSSINIGNARTSSSFSTSSSTSARGGPTFAANVSGGSEFAEDSEESKRVNDARILISNTHANQHLLNRRIGKMDEIERSLAALEKMQLFVSEAAYAAKMRSAFASLPVFGTYETDVVANVVAPTASTTTKRVRSNGNNSDDNVHQHNDDAVKKTKTAADCDMHGTEEDKTENIDRGLYKSDGFDRGLDESDGFESPRPFLVEDRDYFPIVDRNGKMIAMNYSIKNGTVTTQDGRPMRYLWEKFMDELDSDDEHYPVVDETGKMLSLDTVSKKARVALEAAVAKEHKK